MEIRDGEPYIPCLRCGNCCSRYQVLLENDDVHRIAEFLNIDVDTFIAKYADNSWPVGGKYLVRHTEGGCSFIKRKDGQSLCSIHAVKPRACSEWTPGVFRRECREGLERVWQLTFNADGDLEGLQENKHRFQEFLKTIDA